MVGDLIKAIRPLNLLIVAILQLLLYYNILLPHLDHPRLTLYTFGGFVLSTLLLTASGYLINDYYDHIGDQINKQGWHRLTRSQLIVTYSIVSLLGVAISLAVAYSIGQLSYVSIYVLASILLYSYSAWGKRQPLIGNVMVAVFCGLSITILLLTERPALLSLMDTTPTLYHQIVHLVIGLSVFAFMITLVREMVKDVQDIEGDRAQGYTTLPIIIGIPRTKVMITWYLGVTLALAIWWIISQWQSQSLPANIYFVFGVIGSLIIAIYRSSQLDGIDTYAGLSKLCKGVMLLGIIYVLLV